MFLAHPATGVIAAKLNKKSWNKKDFAPKQKALLLITLIVATVLPDFDLSYALFNGVTGHREYITHTPFPYIITAVLIFAASFLVKNKTRKFIQALSLQFFIGTMLHLLTDTFAHPVKLLSPLSELGIMTVDLYPLIQTDNFIIQYFTTPVLAVIETFFIILAITLLATKSIKKKFLLKVASITFASLSIISVVATLYFLARI